MASRDYQLKFKLWMVHNGIKDGALKIVLGTNSGDG